jgi:hypothetical protein
MLKNTEKTMRLFTLVLFASFALPTETLASWDPIRLAQERHARDRQIQMRMPATVAKPAEIPQQQLPTRKLTAAERSELREALDRYTAEQSRKTPDLRTAAERTQR